MTRDQIKKLVDSLWEKYATADKHGYKDLMRQDSFDSAVRELIEGPVTENVDRVAAMVTKYSNKILELDGANMNSQEIPLLLTEMTRELQGRPRA